MGGAAGVARVEAAARILQREAHRVSITAKAAMGAIYAMAQDPFYADENFEPVKPLPQITDPFKKACFMCIGDTGGVPSPLAAAVAAAVAATNHVNQVSAAYPGAAEVARPPREALLTRPCAVSLFAKRDCLSSHRRAVKRDRNSD